MRVPNSKLVWFSTFIVLAGAVGVGVWLHRHKYVDCVNTESAIEATNTRYRVVSTARLCDGIASSDDVEISLVDVQGKRLPVMSYGAAFSFVQNPREATPTARWIDDRTLQIVISKVAYVTSKKDQIGDVRIDLKIGEVIIK